jgi:hypothetical protein
MGSVPTHGPSCRAWTFPTNCWHCGQAIFVFQCTCESAVLFDSLGWPWPKHDCGGGGGGGGIGGSGLNGWVAADILRANGVSIDQRIMQTLFPSSIAKGAKSKAPPPPKPMTAVQPSAGEQIALLAVIRGLLTGTNRTERLSSLGALGAKLLRLPKGRLWQVTLVVNSVHPNLAYTCIVPERLGLPRDAKNKMAFASLDARVAGDYAIWLATDIRLV